MRERLIVVGLAGVLGALVFAGTGAARQAAAGLHRTTVRVTETEYKLTLPHMSFKAGAYHFVVSNKGKLTHSFEINGPAVHNRRAGNIAPGSTASLNVTLKKGTYTLWCPIDGHRARGMHATLRVA